jgi:predicted dehydrogenase
MASDRLKVGLMGLGRAGQQVAEVLLASSWCELVAVAARKSKRTEQFAEEHPTIDAYDDLRSLIVENALDALFVAIPPFLRTKYLAMAADKRIPVWLITPGARDFSEALQTVNAFKQAKCPIAVARSWGTEPALQADAINLEQNGSPFLARGTLTTLWEDDFDWRGDSVRAGGGVLLDRGYDMMDIIVQLMGIPSSVHMVAQNVSRPGNRYPYDTEDTAAVTCQFTGGGIAVVNACWTVGPDQWLLEVSGTGGTIRLERTRVVCRDRSGQDVRYQARRADNPFGHSIEDFLSSVRTKSKRIASPLQDHLPTLATIQAAYLSSRTGQPEYPSAIYEMHDVKMPEDLVKA